MFARYEKGKRFIISFNLEKELGCAFAFINAGNEASIYQQQLKEDMGRLLVALKQDIIEQIREQEAKRKAAEEAANFALCNKCQTEIKLLDTATWFRVDENGGGYLHVKCPKLKPEELRDFDAY